MIFWNIVLFVVGLCISFSGVFIIAKNTDVGFDLIGEKDFSIHLTTFGWGLSIFLIIVGGRMLYLSFIELLPYLISSFELK